MAKVRKKLKKAGNVVRKLSNRPVTSVVNLKKAKTLKKIVKV